MASITSGYQNTKALYILIDCMATKIDNYVNSKVLYILVIAVVLVIYYYHSREIHNSVVQGDISDCYVHSLDSDTMGDQVVILIHLTYILVLHSLVAWVVLLIHYLNS
jgi:hypothetical protein